MNERGMIPTSRDTPGARSARQRGIYFFESVLKVTCVEENSHNSSNSHFILKSQIL